MIDLFMFGGDVSRSQLVIDAFENVALVDSFTGSSFASMASAKFSPEVALDQVEDPAARRIIERDLGKRFLRALQHSSIDIMLLDFLDERFDLCLASDGTLCTLSDEALKAGILNAVENCSIVKNVSRQYFPLWVKGWQRFLRYAEIAGITKKIRVGMLYWRFAPMEPLHNSKHVQEEIDRRNELLARMYSRVEQDLGRNALLKVSPEHSFIFIGEDLSICSDDQVAKARGQFIEKVLSGQDRQDGSELPITSPFERRKLELASPKQAALGRSFLERGEFVVEGFRKFAFGGSVDWNADPYTNRTWRWSLFQLSFIPSLIAFDLVEGGSSGLRKAIDVLKDWADRFLYSDLEEPAWHDHGSALRARNILLCYSRFKEYVTEGCGIAELQDCISVIERLSEYLGVHCTHLASESFYSVGTNHGLDQSLILYEIASHLPDSPRVSGWKSLARSRISFEIGKAFAPDGGHVENSPGYLNFGLKQAVNAMTLQAAYDSGKEDSELGDMAGLLNRGCRALTHMMRPDGRLPIIGDTAEFTVKDFFTVRPSEDLYEEFRYAVTKGRSGTKPARDCLILPDSGYAIFRSGWSDMDSFEDSVHVVFKCGFLSTYHRQDDDLHLVLSGFGEDWLIDGGLYKHEPKDPLRIYCRSTAAHNLTIPAGVKASRDLTSARSVITSYVDEGDRCSVSGESNMFRGFAAARTVMFDKRTLSLNIKDKLHPISSEGLLIEDSEDRDYISRFLVPSDKEVKVTDDQVLIQGRSAAMIVSSKLKPRRIEIKSGVKQDSLLGWTSRVQHKIEPAFSVEFVFSSKDFDNEISIEFQR